MSDVDKLLQKLDHCTDGRIIVSKAYLKSELLSLVLKALPDKTDIEAQPNPSVTEYIGWRSINIALTEAEDNIRKLFQ